MLLASTRHGAEVAAKAYSGVAKAFGLSVRVQKTKFVVVGKTEMGGGVLCSPTYKQHKTYEGYQLRRMYVVKCVSDPSPERATS